MKPPVDDCSIPRNCGINLYWNPLYCKCEEKKNCVPRDCGKDPNFQWNSATCRCEEKRNCEPVDCGTNPDIIFNPVTCRCEKTEKSE